jgi:iron complex outermembrane receptor protein
MLAAAALAFGFSLDAGATSVASCDTGFLSEVIVTARRREEDAQKVPLSVTAVAGVDLARDRVLTLEDLGHTRPASPSRPSPAARSR